MKKYRGVFPALYACYDSTGHVHPKGIRQLTNLLCRAGVSGIYVNGSFGECDALSVMEKAAVLENAMAEAGGRVRMICRVTCPDPDETRELCRLAAACGVDGVVALPQEGETSLERTLENWQALADTAGDADLIVGPWPFAVSRGEAEKARIRAFAAGARVRGVLVGGDGTARIRDMQAFLGEDISVISFGRSMEAFSAFSEGLDAFLGIYSPILPEIAARLESGLRYDFPSRAVPDLQFLTSLKKALDGCGAPLDAAKSLLSRLRGVECGPVRPPLPRMDEKDREIVEICFRELSGRLKQ